MNWWEDMALNVVLGLVHGLVKNPAKQTAARALLLHLADSIYTVFGLTPVVHD